MIARIANQFNVHTDILRKASLCKLNSNTVRNVASSVNQTFTSRLNKQLMHLSL